MAPLPIIANTYRCALNWQDSTGRTAENVIHVRKAASTAAGIFADLDSEADLHMWAPVSSIMSVRSISVTPLDGTSPTEEFATNTDGRWFGGGGGDPIPQSAALVSFKTALRGRSYRGRIYLPFVSEGVQNAGTISSAVVTDTQSAWDDFIADLAGELVVASYKHATAQAVTTCKAEDKAGTQRKRMTRLR